MQDIIKDSLYIIGLVFLGVLEWFRSRKKKSKSLFANLEVSVEIDKILINLLLYLKCDRVMLCQFSNSENYFSGQGIEYLSITNEWVRDEKMEKKGSRYQKTPINGLALNIIMEVMIKGKLECLNKDSIVDSRLRSELQSSDVATALYVRVTDGSKEARTVAMLCVHWHEETAPVTPQDVYRIQSHAVKDIESIFIKNL